MDNIFTVKMPDIGEGVVEGEVVQWLKKVEDTVAQDEPVVIVMTDKATVELPSPVAGKLIKQYYQTGEVAKCDQPLYEIETLTTLSAKNAPKSLQAPTAPTPSKHPKPTPPLKSGNVMAAPPVRKLARELGIDIESISGTGKEGLVTIEDLKLHTPSQSEDDQVLHLPEDAEIPLIGIRKLMAKKMKISKSEIPHFSYFEQAEATRLVQLRDNVKEAAVKEGVTATYMPFLIKALSLTIQKFPLINSMLDTESQKIVIHKHQNIGIAVSTTLGLIVPVLKNVQRLTLIEIIKNYAALKLKAKEGQLTLQEMKEATITLSNFGVLGGGGLWATPIINYPEVAILAVAKIQKQPVVRNDTVVVRDVLNLSWSFDHRVIDGDLAASISHYFSQLIHNPAQLL